MKQIFSRTRTVSYELVCCSHGINMTLAGNTCFTYVCARPQDAWRLVGMICAWHWAHGWFRSLSPCFLWPFPEIYQNISSDNVSPSRGGGSEPAIPTENLHHRWWRGHFKHVSATASINSSKWWLPVLIALSRSLRSFLWWCEAWGSACVLEHAQRQLPKQ